MPRIWCESRRSEATGVTLPASLVAGQPLLARDGRPVLVIDGDVTLVIAHRGKEQARATFKRSWGFHPVMAFCDNTNEALTAMLRPGNAGSNTAADHIAVVDAALAQIPPEFWHGYPALFRFDGAGASKALLAHLRGLRTQHVDVEFSVGWGVGAREHAAIAALPETAWTPAIDSDGDPREGAAVVELTDTAHGQHAWLDDRHRATPASKTESAAARTPDWPGCRPSGSRSTPRGWPAC